VLFEGTAVSPHNLLIALLVLLVPTAALPLSPAIGKDGPALRPVSPEPPHVSTDKSVNYDYDIVYVRAPRHGDERPTGWAEFSDPTRMEQGADLMLLHPDGSEELLVSGKDGSVMDPYVSFDGESVFYAKFIDTRHSGADIYKIHVKTRRVTRLTDQTFTPNTGAALWLKNYRFPENGQTRLPYGVFNLGPCPAPGGRIVFTSNRNAHVPPRGYPKYTLQLFAMDENGGNVEQIGYLNIACALHPVILKDGRILFSSLESQGMHNPILWAVWSIHPDGTNWGPVVSAFATHGAPSGFHFQAQLSDESVIVEEYYNLNNNGFGTYFKLPPRPSKGVPAFGPGWLGDPRNAVDGYAGRKFQQPFTPSGAEVLTRFTHGEDAPAPSKEPGEAVRARRHGGSSYPRAVGKVTHPCGAPDNHLLTAWTPGPANQQYDYYPLVDSGIYLIKAGKPIDQPGQMLLIKNDPRYNEQWPRPLVPYKRIYGVDEPTRLIHKNDGRHSPHLPEGTPFGLVGTSSLYKRESAPGGRVPEGGVTAVAADPRRLPFNWALQGADAGVYDNSEIHAIRILAQEPRTDTGGGGHAPPLYANHALERLRILGEIPVRKFGEGAQPLDPDGNPDTSFLAKIPADQSFTFQTLDKDGMALNLAQTWHQLRPGESRYDCGGCHAHSQRPTPFEKTAAAKPDYMPFDLTRSTPLLTSRVTDESGEKWDEGSETGLRFEKGIKNVEYYRDVRPIFERSCFACHTRKAEKPSGALVLDDDDKEMTPAFGHDSGPDVRVPAAYFRIAGFNRERPRTGHGYDSATRYVRMFQSRRSLLVWKIYGRRTDGWTNDDFPSLTVPGDPKSLRWKGEPIPRLNYDDPQALNRYIRDSQIDVDYTGGPMPPRAALVGMSKGPDGKPVKVPPLTDEDRRTIVRWIDLGCPIDLDPAYNPAKPRAVSYGWMGDDQRPTLTLTYPEPGPNSEFTRILVGMADAYTGLDADSFRVVTDFPVDGVPAGENLAARLKPKSPGVWELRLLNPITDLAHGRLTVSVKDRQGNISRIDRIFTVKAVER
jgi:Hydrazine synthase alpha subunit middle domain